MIKVIIIGYTLLHLFFYACQSCMQNERYWMPYYIWDEMFGGGVLLWYMAYRKSIKYKVATFFTFIFSCVRCAWNIALYIFGINQLTSRLDFILCVCLLPVIYFTMFSPESRTTKFLDEHLKMIGI